VNWQHLKAIAWLRWRLTVNQWKKGGSVNAVLGIILLTLGSVAAVLSLFVSLLVGILLFPSLEPDSILALWDVLVVGFLFCWVMGLVTDLQRSEALSLDKLMHLPVSPSGTFFLNYLSSLISMTLIIFVPTTVGLSLALVIVKGPAMLILFPLLGTFLLMVTGVTHQFREWLHLLMLNKRRRRAIVVFVTAAFILLAQLPNVINMVVQRGRSGGGVDEHQLAINQLQQKISRGELEASRYNEELAALEQQRQEQKKQEESLRSRRATRVAAVANAVLPIGWLPYGARAAAQGSLWPGLLGSLGALALGCLSLRRSYRTTLRFYTGGFQTGERKQTSVVDQRAAPQTGNFLEHRIRWVPEPAAAVAVGGFRCLTRSPEGKMLLLVPLILIGVFGTMVFAGRARNIPELARPLLGLGVINVTMLCFTQILCNLFGVDRDGFRAFVLAPVCRRDVLLGKNLAIAPFALGVGCLVLVVLQALQPMGSLHFLATLVQLLIAFLLCCLIGNVVSILAPSAVSVGSLKPAKAKISTVLIHLLVTLLSPVVLLPGIALFGSELLAHLVDGLAWLPLYLVLSLFECAAVVWIYRRSLASQGRWLQSREQTILEVVTQRAE
jgi:ABC-2 type transport system permease protein